MFNSSQEIIKTFTHGADDNKKDFLLRENSNFVYSLPLLRHNIDNFEEEKYLMDEVFTKELKDLYEEKVIYVHDKKLAPYCNSISCLTVATVGVPTISKNMLSSKPTKKIGTLFRQLSNLVTLVSQQSSGAIMLSQMTTVLAGYLYYTDKELGKKIAEEDLIDLWYNFIWEVNLPLRSGSQSAFSNITMEFGKPSDEVKSELIIVGGEVMMEEYGQIPSKYFDKINNTFITAMAKGTGTIPFTFPLITVPVTDDFDFSNKTFLYLLDQMYKWNGCYFENFRSKPFEESKYSKLNPMIKPRDPEVSRSLCCFTEDERVIYKSENGIIKVDSMKNINGNVQLFNSDGWVKAKKIVLPNRKMYKVKTHNGIDIIMSDNHINLTYNGNKFTKDLTTNDYLAFNEKSMISYNSDDYMLGKFIGIIAGDGSLSENEIKICLNYDTKDYLVKEIEEFLLKYDLILSKHVTNNGIKGTEVPVYNVIKNTSGGDISEKRNYLFSKLKQYITFENAHKKILKDGVLNESNDFKQGVIDGYYETDGGNKGRIYSVNKQLIESFATMLNSMGISYNISIDDRDSTKTLSDNPIYCIRPYAKYHKQYKNFFKRKDDKIFFKIISIDESDYSKEIHSFEMENQNNPYYVLANGLYTHNCRLQIDLELLSKVGGGIFGSSSGNTGAVQVLNANMNRLLMEYKYEYGLDWNKFTQRLEYVFEVMQENHQRKREWIINNKELYPTFFAYNKDLKNYFNVFAVSAMHEGLINIGYKGGMDDTEGKLIAHRVMQYIHTIMNKFIIRDKVACGIEYAPNEGGGVAFARADVNYGKKIGIDVFVQGNKETDEVYTTSGCMIPFAETDFIKQIENASEFQAYATSGSILHQFLEDKLPPEKLAKHIDNVFKKPIIYTTLTPTSTSCMSCGNSIVGKDAKDIHLCPICGSDDLATFSRVIGYSKMISRKGIKVNEYGKYEGEFNFWSNSRRIDWASRKRVTEETINEISE